MPIYCFTIVMCLSHKDTHNILITFRAFPTSDSSTYRGKIIMKYQKEELAIELECQTEFPTEEGSCQGNWNLEDSHSYRQLLGTQSTTSVHSGCFWGWLASFTEKAMALYSITLAWKIHGWRSLAGYGLWGRWESDMTERLHIHFHALEKEMATHSSVLAWRIPGMEEPGGLPSMGLHRVGHDWSDLA